MCWIQFRIQVRLSGLLSGLLTFRSTNTSNSEDLFKFPLNRENLHIYIIITTIFNLNMPNTRLYATLIFLFLIKIIYLFCNIFIIIIIILYIFINVNHIKHTPTMGLINVDSDIYQVFHSWNFLSVIMIFVLTYDDVFYWVFLSAGMFQWYLYEFGMWILITRHVLNKY